MNKIKIYYSGFFILLSFLIISCGKKEQPTVEIPKPDTVTTHEQTTGVDTANKNLAESKFTKKDVQRKFGEIRNSFDKDDESLGSTEVRIGDINGDGKEDALIDYVIVPKGGNITLRTGVAVYIYDGEKLNLLLQYDFPYIAYVDKIKDNLLYCVRTEFRKSDPACCPSIKKPFKMKLEDNKLVLADLK